MWLDKSAPHPTIRWVRAHTVAIIWCESQRGEDGQPPPTPCRPTPVRLGDAQSTLGQREELAAHHASRLP